MKWFAFIVLTACSSVQSRPVDSDTTRYLWHWYQFVWDLEECAKLADKYRQLLPTYEWRCVP